MEEAKYLIVNADDYGRTPGVSNGIREAHLRGIVTSTSALMNMPWIEEDLRIAVRETPDLGLGVHLVLTCGTPLRSPDRMETITGGHECFPDLQEFLRRLPGVDPEQAAAEWETQIRRFIELTGRHPDHLDSHHHAACFTEALFEKFLGLARRYRCGIRIPFPTQSGFCDGLPQQFAGAVMDFVPRLLRKDPVPKPDWFIGTFYDELATYEQLLRILDQLEPGVSELMCHPGFADPALLNGSAYGKPREREVEILTMESIRQVLAGRGVQLINFADLA
jgi:predicted glycoside hydrolase/deacetylase ChbG (UPF0249 family)